MSHSHGQRPLCHASEAFNSSSGEISNFDIIAARSHTIGASQYRWMSAADTGPRSNDGQMIKVVVMGFSRKRTGRDGKPRYTAYYLDIRGQERSAGTFSNKKDANDAWKEAEADVSAGKQGDPSRGKQTFQAYVLEKWLPHHQLEPGVRSELRRPDPQAPDAVLRADEDARHHARARPPVGHQMKAKGASARTIEYCKGSILNAIFTTALDDEVVTIHPSRGVKTPPVPKQAPAHHHRRPVRPALPGAARRRRAAAGGDRYRKRDALGRADRAAGPAT